MSFTSVVEARSHTSSVFLTPTKRRRLEPESHLVLPSSTAEINTWVLTSGAIAPCFICDIRVMKRHKEKGEEFDFWWLKRVPCRTVKLVGTVVGIDIYEKRIIYLVDDGTSVIECVHKCGPPPQSSPTKKAYNKKKPSTNDSISPKPLFWVGQTVEIVGQINELDTKGAKREPRRQIRIQKIVGCKSESEKLRHWQTVLNLHDSNYSLSQSFTIPVLLSSPSQYSVSSTPSEVLSTPSAPSTPSTVLSTPSSEFSTTSGELSTPASSINLSPGRLHKSPRKLRHPARLHTADLTNNTFRIYVKHYLDNPPTLEGSDDESSLSEPSTPTRKSLFDRTPRRPSFTGDKTPRPTRSPVSLIVSSQFIPSKSIPRKGFTLSHLRRVPELSELARRVIKANIKRHDREIRKRMKEDSRSQSRSGRSQMMNSVTTVAASSKDPISSQIKQLWCNTIIQLSEDGDIVLWNGPKYPIGCMNNSIWKSSASSSAETATSGEVFALSSVSEREDEGIYLSDPDPDEEAYIALTPELLLEEVERVIYHWITTCRLTDSPKFTTDGILQALRRDDRWRRLGNWHVKEAMGLLVSKGSVYLISEPEGKWGLSQGFTQTSVDSL